MIGKLEITKSIYHFSLNSWQNDVPLTTNAHYPDDSYDCNEFEEKNVDPSSVGQSQVCGEKVSNRLEGRRVIEQWRREENESRLRGYVRRGNARRND